MTTPKPKRKPGRPKGSGRRRPVRRWVAFTREEDKRLATAVASWAARNGLPPRSKCAEWLRAVTLAAVDAELGRQDAPRPTGRPTLEQLSKFLERGRNAQDALDKIAERWKP